VNFCNLLRLFCNFIILNPQASHNIRLLIINTLKINSFKFLNKSRKKFITNVLISFLSIKGRPESSARTGEAINFLQLERFGAYCESTYRTHFEEKFDFFEFNKHLVKQISDEIIIGFDPSYLSKSG